MNAAKRCALLLAAAMLASLPNIADVARASGLEAGLETTLRAQHFSGAPTGGEARLIDILNRLTAKLPVSSAWQLELSYELTAGHLKASPAYIALLAPRPRLYRLDDLPAFPSRTATGEFVAQNLDRAMASYYGDGLTVDIGRQQIAFGSGQMVNPTDVLAPRPFAALASDVRSGVDGLRMRRQLGEMSQIDGGIVAPATKEAADLAGYVSVQASFGQLELRPMVAAFYEAVMLGLDVGTTLGGAGLWWESAYVLPPRGEDPYLRSVLGAMSQLGPLSTLAVEYHYNGAGSAEAARYPLLPAAFAYRKGGVLLRGQHYLGLTTNVRPAPLLTVSSQLIANLTDRSAYGRVGGEWEAIENVYLALHLRRGFGRSATHRAAPHSAPLSEFGGSLRSILLSAQVFF